MPKGSKRHGPHVIIYGERSMLPLLPALILLLLHGPAGIERNPLNGRSVSGIEALQRHAASTVDRGRMADDVVFASLLAASRDQGISQALLRLLTSVDGLLAETVEDRPRPEFSEQRNLPIRGAPTLGVPRDGYLDCRRSRDGPR